ncbi:Golgin candidate 1 [Sesamum angolense]|uniref:Golgin candidate 1 n=1 Tax=Sesamum angolense TaxID=2727404 RepID=A0AAE2BNA2_9LAMI|nr:Golgin candidate 1 [Sesamum angolense]
MASWLKAAEDLFEVVDRRAKLVVGEKSDELPVPTPGSNRRGSHAKKSRPRSKKKLLPDEVPSALDEREQTITETSQSQAEPDGNVPISLIESSDNNPGISGKVDIDEQHKADRDGSTTENSVSGTISNDEAKPVGDHLDVETSKAEVMASNLNGDLRMAELADTPVGNPSTSAKDVDIVNGNSPADSNQNMMSEEAGPLKTAELSESQTAHEDAATKADSQSKDLELVIEPGIQNKQHKEQRTVTSAVKVQEQLDEAQGLLKSAISTGQSKEARLARVCAGLSTRLQEYKSENAQLEELLVAERELTKSYEAHIKQLQKDVSASKGEVSRVEANMVEALSAKNAEIEALVSSVDALKKQAALSEGNLASLQANMESIMRNRELTETRMMQALREELAAAERRAEEERSAHNATKLAAREREVELEQRAIEASTALARIQRTADDRASKAAELEQKVALLEAECSSLNQELQDMEARIRRGQKKSPEDANQAIQAEVQKMRVEMAAMKRDAEHYSRQPEEVQFRVGCHDHLLSYADRKFLHSIVIRLWPYSSSIYSHMLNMSLSYSSVTSYVFEQEHMELEKRYRELTDLLYYKQTQLETMASEKAAAEFQLEKEVKRLQEAQLEAERNRVSRRASSSWEEDTDMKALEPLPLHHRHMAGASLQLQKAAKLLDTGAVRATRFLWRYPTARISLLCYLMRWHRNGNPVGYNVDSPMQEKMIRMLFVQDHLPTVFVHFFLMYLLHRLQEQADTYTSREVAASMGLLNKTLP